MHSKNSIINKTEQLYFNTLKSEITRYKLELFIQNKELKELKEHLNKITKDLRVANNRIEEYEKSRGIKLIRKVKKILNAFSYSVKSIKKKKTFLN